MKIKGDLGAHLSGKLNNGYYAAYYSDRGKSYLKSIPQRPKNKEWTEKQLNARKRLASIAKFSKNNMETLIRPIWKKYHVGNSTGYNLFQKENKHAFDSLGELIDKSLIHASIGDLPMPKNLHLEKDVKNHLALIYWDYSPLMGHQRDELYIAAFKYERFILPTDTKTHREETICMINLPEYIKEGDYLYIFFANTNHESFTNSIALKW